MESNIICAVLLILVWVLNGKKISYGIKEKVAGEAYHHIGIGLFLTVVVVEYFYKNSGMIFRLEILWLKIIGYLLFIPSAMFIFGSLYQLKTKGKAESLGPQGTNKLVDTGVFSIVRHPMWIGFSLWAFALILSFQSIFSLLLSIVSIICFRIASVKEDDEGVRSFGNAYREYIKKVPMWNFITFFQKKE